MGRPRLHDEKTRDDLLRAAEGVIAKRGVDALSIRVIADEVGTTTRAIYSVFGNKDGLLGALYRESFTALIRAVDAVPLTDDPRHDLLHAGLDGFRRYATDHPNLFRFVFEGIGLNPSHLPREDGEVGLEALGRLRSRVQRCADAGVVEPGDVPTVTTAFHALCQGLASMELQRCLPMSSGGEADQLWEDSLEALVTGFASGTAADRSAGDR